MPSNVKADFKSGFRIISSYLTDHKKEVVALSVLGVFGAALGAVVPYLGGQIIDAIIEGETVQIAGQYVFNAAFFFVAIFFIVRLFQDLLNWRVSLESNKLGAYVESEYASKNISKLLDLP